MSARRDLRRLIQVSFLVVGQETDQHSVDPAPGHDRVQAADDDMKLRIKGAVEILNFAVMPVLIFKGEKEKSQKESS
jgi:hypothetical protein